MTLVAGVLFREPPAADVHFVDTLVRDIAVSGVPEPMPVVVETIRIERLHCGRSHPQIVVDARRHRRIGFVADRFTALVAQPFRHIDLAESAFAHQIDGALVMFQTARLHSTLHDAIVFARGLYRAPSFADVVTGRFFHIHVFSGLAGPDGGKNVPVIRRGNGHCVDIFVVEDFSQIAVGLGRRTLELLEIALAASDLLLIDVADGRHAAAAGLREIQHVIAPTAAQSDHGDVDAIVRAQYARAPAAAATRKF